MSHPDAEFLKKYLQPLVGCKVTKVEVTVEDDEFSGEEAWPVIWVQKPGPKATAEVFKLEVSCDEEGNGPGFLFGLPLPA